MVATRTELIVYSGPNPYGSLTLNLTQSGTAIVGSSRGFHGSDRVTSGHGDPPRQRATVEMPPYLSKVPHMTNYSIIHTTNTFGDTIKAAYIRRIINCVAQILHRIRFTKQEYHSDHSY